MKQVIKAIVGAVTVVGLLGSAMGVALAAGASSNAFQANASTEAPYINHGVGRYVFNSDTVAAHNAVADLGMIRTNNVGAGVTYKIYYSNAGVGSIGCWLIAYNLDDNTEAAATPFVSLPFNSGVKTSISIGTQTLTANKYYAVNLFCNIPATASNGGTANIYGVTLPTFP
jgi:hypothetical protein